AFGVLGEQLAGPAQEQHRAGAKDRAVDALDVRMVEGKPDAFQGRVEQRGQLDGCGHGRPPQVRGRAGAVHPARPGWTLLQAPDERIRRHGSENVSGDVKAPLTFVSASREKSCSEPKT